MLLNIMASIPKKVGHRLVAVASTLYRLLMQLDHDNLSECERANAYQGDSARRGASAVDSAEDRALEIELAKFDGKLVCQLLWNLEKFFGKDHLGGYYALGNPSQDLRVIIDSHGPE